MGKLSKMRRFKIKTTQHRNCNVNVLSVLLSFIGKYFSLGVLIFPSQAASMANKCTTHKRTWKFNEMEHNCQILVWFRVVLMPCS